MRTIASFTGRSYLVALVGWAQAGGGERFREIAEVRNLALIVQLKHCCQRPVAGDCACIKRVPDSALREHHRVAAHECSRGSEGQPGARKPLAQHMSGAECSMSPSRSCAFTAACHASTLFKALLCCIAQPLIA